jgi:hypothetical protein
MPKRACPDAAGGLDVSGEGIPTGVPADRRDR